MSTQLTHDTWARERRIRRACRWDALKDVVQAMAFVAVILIGFAVVGGMEHRDAQQYQAMMNEIHR